ncbi:MAG TPA: hypothetical protein VEL28_05095 [Candidatus Binatia bacterium]|nr:hypothetical protein [Candidatus Binatia bacterium]
MTEHVDTHGKPDCAADTVEVTVSGLVEQGGRVVVPAPATVAKVLEAAGGFTHAEHKWPLGVLTVRRLDPSGGRTWRFHTATRAPEEWEGFRLQKGDMLTVQRILEERHR